MDSIKETSRHEYISRINKVLEYIENNIGDKLSLEKLSEVSCFSQFHFHRVFHAFIGETPNEFVARIRLEKAAIFLSYKTTDSITEAALRYGFSSSSAFARAFKNHFGISATSWRNGGYAKHKISKIGKTDSKIEQEFIPPESYVYSGNNKHFNNNIKAENMKVEIKDMPSLHVAYLAVYDGYTEKIGVAYERLCKWAAPRGLLNKDTKFLGVAFDSPDITPKEKCRYNACMTIPDGVVPEKGINVTDIPAAKCIVAHFRGVKEEISGFYDNLFNVHLPENGFLPGDMPAYEIYLNDPKTDPDGMFVLDAYVPVKPL